MIKWLLTGQLQGRAPRKKDGLWSDRKDRLARGNKTSYEILKVTTGFIQIYEWDLLCI